MHTEQAGRRAPETPVGESWAQRADELRAELQRCADSTDSGVEVVTPGAAVAPHVFRAATACSQEGVSLELMELPLLGMVREMETGRVIEDGLTERKVFQRIVRSEPAVLQENRPFMDALVEADRAARYHPDVPLRLLGFDHRVVFVALDPVRTRTGCFLVRRTALVDAWYDLFEEIWAQSSPPRKWSTLPVHGQGMKAKVLGLLADGLKDETIARRLGLSDRTVRRVAAELQRDYGATSRFQLAILAAADSQQP